MDKTLYLLKKKIRHTLRSIHLFFRKKRNTIILKKNIKNGIFPVEIISTNGLGGRLVTALQIIDFCDQNDLTPYIKFKHLRSKSKEDYFGYFFEIRNQPFLEKKSKFAKMAGFPDLNINLDSRINMNLTLEKADILIKKHLKIKDNILSYVDNFYDANLKGKQTLGVHYRATDKKEEASLLSFNNLVANIKSYLKKHPETNSIFIATDDDSIIPKLIELNLPQEIIFHEDSYRSNNDLPPHLSGKGLYEINHDALVNCLLLSKCTVLMKTASILSGWSKLFNPDLPLIILSKPFERHHYFPESEFTSDILLDVVQE